MESTTEQQPSNGYQAFRLYLAGQGRLRTAYWGFGVAGTLILYFFLMLGMLLITPFAHRNGGSVLDSTAARVYLALAFLILLGYQVLVGVLIWRNAHNTRNPVWSQVAKLIVVLSAVLFLYEAVKQI